MSRYQVTLFGIATAVFIVTGQSRLARGQCEPQWLPGDGLPGTDGTVYAVTTWDPDGAGPQPPLLVIGGDFRVAGDALVNYVAAGTDRPGRPSGVVQAAWSAPWRFTMGS